MNDPAIAEFLNENYICTYKQVSTFRVLAPGKRTNADARQLERIVGWERESIEKLDLNRQKEASSFLNQIKFKRNGGNVASYFLEPGGHVLQIVLGPVRPNDLLTSAESALELNQKLASATDHEIRDQIASKHLKTSIPPEYVTAYSDLRSNGRLSKAKNLDTGVTRTDQEFRNAFLANYLALHMSYGNAYGLDDRSVFPEVIPHGFTTVGRSCENLALTEFPLPELQQIEKHVFQVLLGQPYNPVGETYREKLETVKTAFARKQGVVALLTDRQTQKHPTVKPKEFVPLKKSDLIKMGSIRNQSERFCLIEMSISELFAIFSDLGIAPVQGSLENRKIESNGWGAVLFDSSGQVRKVLPSGIRPQLVSNAMKRITD